MNTLTTKIHRFTRAALASSLLFSATGAIANDWADDWLQSNATYSGPSSYSGGARNFITAGNIPFRANSSISYPISMSAPRLALIVLK